MTHIPDQSFFICSLCNQNFRKPITLACGHTFCHFCIHQKSKDKSVFPVCPTCGSIVWRPIDLYKENVAISNLMNRYNLQHNLPAKPLGQVQKNDNYILIQCLQVNSTPMPYCYCQVMFATSFIDQILQQTNQVVLRWPKAKQNIAIKGKLFRPQIYYTKMIPYQQVYKVKFEGITYVQIQNIQKLTVPITLSSDQQKYMTNITLCHAKQIQSINHLNLSQFDPFFNVYDQLNNPIYIRQIASFVSESVLSLRNDPHALIYCVLRLLRITENQRKQLIESLDDSIRWKAIQTYLHNCRNKLPIQIIKIQIPGNYPSALIFLLLLSIIILHYCFIQ